MPLFRDDVPRWRDLAEEIVALLRKADEIDDDKWEQNDTIILKSADLTAWGIPPRRDGPTLLLHRGGQDGRKRLLIYCTGDELPVLSCPWERSAGVQPGTGLFPQDEQDKSEVERRTGHGKGDARPRTARKRKASGHR
jgi:hypothetical protein